MINVWGWGFAAPASVLALLPGLLPVLHAGLLIAVVAVTAAALIAGHGQWRETARGIENSMGGE